MATEINEKNYTANVNSNNLDLNTDNPLTKQVNQTQEKFADFAQPKKRYYLASCDENISMLKKEQEQGLTDILIALKKEHDNIKMESQKITEQTLMLEKKIKVIQQMDAKTEKKNVESKFQNENIKKAIEYTKERLKEEEYKKKTLTALLAKIKKDVNINELTLQKSYDKQNILNQKLQRQKLLENEIKAKGNQINNQINTQKEKNIKDLKEYSLQVQYYNTIIAQKKEFIDAAEKRKKKQLEIAQDAKKTSGDKDEKEKREKLQLLYLINNYLQKKMEKELEKNKEIESAFSKIRLICGTNNLKAMIDKILLKDKKYNYTIKQINEQERQKKLLTEEIKELQEKFVKLKNEIVVDIDTINKKDIQIIKSKDYESALSNKTLIEEEIELNEKYNLNKEINNLVNLRYDQVVNALRRLCTEESINYLKGVSNNASNVLNNNNKSGISNIGDQSNINIFDISNHREKETIINDNENENIEEDKPEDKQEDKNEDKQEDKKEDKNEDKIEDKNEDKKEDKNEDIKEKNNDEIKNLSDKKEEKNKDDIKKTEDSSDIVSLKTKLQYKEGEENKQIDNTNNNNNVSPNIDNNNNTNNNNNNNNNNNTNVNNNNVSNNNNVNNNNTNNNNNRSISNSNNNNNNISNTNNTNNYNRISNNRLINNNKNNNINNNMSNTNINNMSSNIIDNTYNNNISLLDECEEMKLINAYKDYLAQADKTIDALFLMRTKNDFMDMIREKANEFDEANKTMKIIKKYNDLKKGLNKSASVRDFQYNELEYCADDNDSKENEIQDKIFRTYMNAERRKMEKFIYNEREGKK